MLKKKNDDGVFENIFIRDEGRVLTKIGSLSSTIIAKSGYLSNEEKNLVLLNGNIQKINPDGNVNVVKFEKTVFPLSGISTKSISAPKLQETSTLQIINCMRGNYFNSHNCKGDKKNQRDTKIEVNKRFGLPAFIPLIALICCFLLSTRKDSKLSGLRKYIYGLISVIILTGSEVVVRYSGISWGFTGIFYILPLTTLPIIYFFLIRTFKYENI